MKMYKVTLCVLSLAIVLSLTSALPVRMERSSPSQDLTSKFDDLMTNFDEIKVRTSVCLVNCSISGIKVGGMTQTIWVT